MKLGEPVVAVHARILVVDDHPEMLRAIARVVRSGGHDVMEASTGAEALSAAAEFAPEILLVDFVLPDIDGIEVCRRVKTDPSLEHTHVVLMSSVSRSSDVIIEALENGADDFLAQPMSNAELLARLNRTVRIVKTEEALRTSQRNFWAVAEALPMSIAIVQHGHRVYVNPAAESMTGYSREELLARPFVHVTHPGDRERSMRMVRDCLESGGPVREDGQFVRNDGSVGWADFSVVPLRYEGHRAVLTAAMDISASREAAAAAETSRASYQRLVEEINAVIWEYDVAESRFVYVSPQVERLLGYPLHNWLEDGELWQSAVHADDIAALIEYATVEVEAGRDFEIEHRTIRPDGANVWMQHMIRLVRDANDEIAGLRGTMVDVTRRKEAELRLSLRDRVIATAVTPMMFADGTFTVTDVNQAFLDLFGLESKDLIVGQRTDGFANSEFVGSLNETLLRDGSWVGELLAVPAADEPVDVHISATLLRDERGLPEQCVVACLNITQRRRAERALTTSEERLRVALDAGGMVTWEWDLRTGDGHWSSNAPELLLGSAALPMDRTYEAWRRRVHPDDLELTDQVVERSRLTGSDGEVEYRIVRPDGSIHWILGRGRFEYDAQGKATTMHGVLQTIDDRKQAEQERERLIGELEAKNAELERFAYTVSHDLKNPLLTIRGFAGMLARDAVAGNLERLDHHRARIDQAAGKMQDLLNDVLELSRVGRVASAPVRVSLSEIVSEAVELLAEPIAATGASVRYAPDLPAVLCDRERLCQAFTNLIGNATKFVGDQAPPLIEIGSRGEGKVHYYFVKDNGIGIAPRHHDRVFGLFNRLDAETEGTGIGLALVRRIIEVHGGRIWIESAGDGTGTEFRFTLGDHPAAS